MKCPNCNKEISDGFKFCPYCATPIVANKCPYCSSTNLPADSKFCPHCGHKIVEGLKPLTFCVKGVYFTMIPVGAGTFQMGSNSGRDNEMPAHNVTISKDFYMGETEVTQALWEAVMDSRPTIYGGWGAFGLGADYPAYRVSWEDCQIFIQKLNSLTGHTFRMPTEAEWEYAARGGNLSNGYMYSGSNIPGDVAWHKDNSGSKTQPVKTRTANELGLYDMSGNLWEWCSDLEGSYDCCSQTDPTGAISGSYRVCRGGSWGDDATMCRCTSRCFNAPSALSRNIGFRLAL